ncbi:fungal-specific transcription factor domain-containing protein [Apodospora peruviana]|uniref:Fungal-specific transcription factor domain-containing protein n=1 Tax=Apodospora peruviana TaxID=516989 RepID=A0AAE0HUH2_9PEZI|nr:fungal-specific transcription factor domain-containing protein [Apodospora peruviana]
MVANQSGKRRSPSEGASESSGQDHPSPPAQGQRQSSKQQVRHRASVACASCRERRIRCVVPEGSSECTQCKRSGAECIIKNDDERRRPISKAYMSSLSNRIALLEGMLQERGVVPPPAIHPPKTRQDAQVRQHQDQHQSHAPDSPRAWESNRPRSPERDAYTPFVIKEEDTATRDIFQGGSVISESFTSHVPSDESSVLQAAPSKEGDNTEPLLSGDYVFPSDDPPWKFQFYGPTASSHVYAAATGHFSQPGPLEQVGRTRRFIQALSPSTLDHLMGCFWDHYNPGVQLVDQSAFEDDQGSQRPNFYSPFLHITMMAAGYRFADRDREAVKRLTLGTWESTLHRESRSLMEVELERPGGIASVQALLILADLEFGVGRDATGWMYSGIANRLAFSIGLHAESANKDISDAERRVRRQVMTACVVSDRQCALLLGRPTSIKRQDLGIELSSKETHASTSATPSLPFLDHETDGSRATDIAVHQHLVELMDLSARIADSQNTTSSTAAISTTGEAENNAYIHAVTLDQQLQNWYRRLPPHLTWNPVISKTAPLSYFMLHQQYHTCMILLHRPWAKYGPIVSDNTETANFAKSMSKSSNYVFPLGLGSPQSIDKDSRVTLSRRMCTQHAVKIARIFWHHRQRFDGRKISAMGIQHAGTAALALMAALALRSPELDHRSNLSYLQVLSIAIYDMSRIYQPAARMYRQLKTTLTEIRAGLIANAQQWNFNANKHANVIFRSPTNSWRGSTPHITGNHFDSIFSGCQENNSSGSGLTVQQHTFKRRRLGPGSRRASELAVPTASFFEVAATAGDYSSSLTQQQQTTHKPFSLGKHGRQRSVDDIVISEKTDTTIMSDDLAATWAFDFDFVNAASAPPIVDGSEEREKAAAEERLQVVDNTDCIIVVGDDMNVDGDISGPMASEDTQSLQSNMAEPQVSGLQQQNKHSQEPEQRDPSEAAEMTIEEWLAEPPGLTPSSLQHDTDASAGSPEACSDTLLDEPMLSSTAPADNSDTRGGGDQHLSSGLDGVDHGDGTTSSDDLESWMAATFGIGADGVDQMISPMSLNPSLSELVRSVESIVGTSCGDRGAALSANRANKKTKMSKSGGGGVGVKNLEALDFLQL